MTPLCEVKRAGRIEASFMACNLPYGTSGAWGKDSDNKALKHCLIMAVNANSVDRRLIERGIVHQWGFGEITVTAVRADGSYQSTYRVQPYMFDAATGLRHYPR